MLLLALLCVEVAARSGGLFQASDVALTGCDFDGVTTNWGCQTRQWNYTTQITSTPSRTECMDTDKNRGPKFMWWTSAPQPAAGGQWSLRSGDQSPASDPTTYPPSGIMSIYIRVTSFDKLYRGLLMYAKDASGKKVGNWNVPYDSTPLFASDTSHKCNQSVMHLSAEDKPYIQKFNFLTPPAGTGQISIRAMIKTGPPNPTDWGGFWRLTNLVLSEGSNKTNNKQWYALPAGVSCTDFCAQNGLEGCDPNSLSQSLADTPALDQTYPCNGATFTSCTGNPGVDLTLPSAFCHYRNASCPTGASCSAVGDATQKLFCVCGQYSYSPTPTSASPRVVPGFITAVLALLTTWSFGRFKLGGIVFLGVALMSATPAQAHNWVEGTRGRAHLLGASQFCSPTFPQLNRNTVHMQIGQNQDFIVEWAAAHTDYTYFIAIHDDDRDKVRMLTRTIMDSWLNNCTVNNFANDTSGPYTKVHRFGPNLNLASTEPTSTVGAPSYADYFVNAPIYNGPIWDKFSDAAGDRPSTFYSRTQNMFGVSNTQGGMYNDLYTLPFNKSLFPLTMLAQYKAPYMANDRRCFSSNSPNYQWIEGIVRFQHHDVGRALATALFSIPGKKGPGRYQVHYKWSSYCDVMDVDVRAAAVAAPYGVFQPANATIYDLGHHCWIPKPQVNGQCIEVVTDTAQCAALCNMDSNCRGYQVLPLQLNPAVSGNQWGQFAANSFIPWDANNSRCNSTQFKNKNIPALGAMVCYTIFMFQDDFNSARPLWEFTRDMDHQGFYGTCFLKPRAVTFTNAVAQVPTPVDNNYQFLSKCIPCDNLGQNFSASYMTPRWGPVQSTCVDCSANAVPTRVLPIPTWTFVNNGTFTDAAHWLSPGGSPYAFANECKLLAARDPTCSKFVMFSQARATAASATTAWRLNNTFFLLDRSTRPGYPYPGYYFSNNSMGSFPYFHNCACLDATPANQLAGFMPTLDATSVTMGCTGITAASCAIKGFAVYQLA